jgi:hypothetical protein
MDDDSSTTTLKPLRPIVLEVRRHEVRQHDPIRGHAITMEDLLSKRSDELLELKSENDLVSADLKRQLTEHITGRARRGAGWASGAAQILKQRGQLSQNIQTALRRQRMDKAERLAKEAPERDKLFIRSVQVILTERFGGAVAQEVFTEAGQRIQEVRPA